MVGTLYSHSYLLILWATKLYKLFIFSQLIFLLRPNYPLAAMAPTSLNPSSNHSAYNADSAPIKQTIDVSQIASPCHLQPEHVSESHTTIKQQQPNLIQFFLLTFHFILNATFINSFALALHDQSHSLDLPFAPTSLTFRIWLWLNFLLSLFSIAAILAIFNLDFFTIKKSAQQILVNASVFLYTAKFLWTIFGAGLYLLLIVSNFQNSHDCILVYCALQFSAFFILLTPITKTLFSQQTLKIQPTYQSLIPSQDFHNQKNTNPHFSKHTISFDTLFYYLPTIIKACSVIGAVCNTGFATLSKATWMDEVVLEKHSMSFRDWMNVETLIIVGLWGVYFCSWEGKGGSLRKVRVQNVEDEVENEEGSTLECVFGCLMLMKIVWILLGSVLFVWYVNIDKTEYMHYYVLGYFHVFYFFFSTLLIQAGLKRSEIDSK